MQNIKNELTTNHLVDFFETNGIITVYDVYQDSLFIVPPPKGSNLRAVLTSLPEHFLRNISEEDRTTNMQELTKIRDSMTPAALSAISCQEKCLILQKAINPQLVVYLEANQFTPFSPPCSPIKEDEAKIVSTIWLKPDVVEMTNDDDEFETILLSDSDDDDDDFNIATVWSTPNNKYRVV